MAFGVPKQLMNFLKGGTIDHLVRALAILKAILGPSSLIFDESLVVKVLVPLEVDFAWEVDFGTQSCGY